MRILVVVAALLIIAGDAIRAQRDGGAGPRPGGVNPFQGGAGPRGGGAGPQGRGGPGRGRGAQVQGTSIIRGLVTAGDTNSPLRRAQVSATSIDVGVSRATTSDANGRFEFLNLPAGRWTLTASKGGFVSQQYGQRRAFESVEPIELPEGGRFTANFTLARGGVITGRISDEFGDAVTGARVEVLRSQMTQGRRRLTPVSITSQTDDTGTFRVFGLAPGEYYVAARPQPTPFEGNGGDGALSFAPTYYPGTGNMGDAQRVRVDANMEQPGINFVLLPVRAVRISGTVTDTTGAPVQAALTLQTISLLDGPMNTRMQGRSLPDGTFTIPNVTPGDYTLEVTTQRRGAGATPEVASVPIAVGNEDVNGVAVVTTKGGTIRGTIVPAGGARLPTTGIQVSAQSLGGGFRGGGLISQVTTTGVFELASLIGSYVLRVDRVPEGWAVTSITVNGKDVTDVPIEIRGSDAIVARVAISDHVNELTGTVRTGSQVATNANVVVFPEDPAQWAFPSRRVRTTRVDKNGVFHVRGLGSGQRYLAVAIDYLEQGEFQDPEFLQSMKARATSLTLGDSDTKNVDLPLIAR